jgi:hypothetical protein
MGKHAPGRSSAIPQRQIQYWQRLPSSTVIPHYLPTAAVAAVLPNANALGPKPSGPTRGAGTRGTGKPLYAPIPKPQRAVRAVRVGAMESSQATVGVVEKPSRAFLPGE